jgi:hypothetical protein
VPLSGDFDNHAPEGQGSENPVGFSIAALVVFVGSLLTCNLLERAAFVFLAAWPIFLFLDAASTARIYRRSPADFQRFERNRIFVELVGRLGLLPAFLAFIVLVELPIFAFATLLIGPALSSYLLGASSRLSCAAASAGILSFAHADGWRINRGSLGICSRIKSPSPKISR